MKEDYFNKKNPGEVLTFDFADQNRRVARIRVVGVGGAGGNAINRMIEDELTGVEFIAMNTDVQALEQNRSPCRLQIGKNLTRGLGAGGNPEIGRKAIEENKDVVIDALSETDMVLVTCGMGGGTGTGAAPVVAEISRDLGALTVGIVTKPFVFEGARRIEKAEMGIRALKENVDTLIVVPNQKLVSIVPKNTPIDSAFRVADEILLHATKGISDVINVPGLVNLDFADVKTVMSQMGDALMGSGVASGENRAQEAAERAISSSLLDDASISGALGVLVNITGGKDLSLNDINEATTIVYNASGPEANIIFGAVIDPSMNGDLRVTVIATGFHGNGLKNVPYRESSHKARSVSHAGGNGNDPLFHRIEMEPLEQMLGEIFGHDGGLSFMSKQDLDIPTFIRKQME
ncbi:MAG: cell division protein FtsZ [bacterium]